MSPELREITNVSHGDDADIEADETEENKNNLRLTGQLTIQITDALSKRQCDQSIERFFGRERPQPKAEPNYCIQISDVMSSQAASNVKNKDFLTCSE